MWVQKGHPSRLGGRSFCFGQPTTDSQVMMVSLFYFSVHFFKRKKHRKDRKTIRLDAKLKVHLLYDRSRRTFIFSLPLFALVCLGLFENGGKDSHAIARILRARDSSSTKRM